jgi:hypothetical protein
MGLAFSLAALVVPACEARAPESLTLGDAARYPQVDSRRGLADIDGNAGGALTAEE